MEEKEAKKQKEREEKLKIKKSFKHDPKIAERYKEKRKRDKEFMDLMVSTMEDDA